MIAHYTLDTSITSLEKFEKDKETIYLLKYANVKTVEPFSKNDMITLIDLITNVNGFFLMLKAPKYNK